MADQRISQLNELGQGSLEAGDLLPIVDSSSSETKKITAKSLFQGAANLADSSSIDLIKLNQASTTKLGVTALELAGTDKIIGRFSSGGGTAQEITLTAAGRQLLDDTTTDEQRTTLGLGTLATQNGTFSGTHSGTSSGTNTGDQTITLTGDVTGTGTGSFATTIAESAVTTAKLPDSAITTAKLAASAVTAAKIANSATTVIAAVSPNVDGVFTGQQWFNTVTGLAYGWDGAVWTQQAGVQSFVFTDSTPLAFSAAINGAGVATITSSLDTQTAATVFAGPTTGSAAAPTFRALVAGDLPIAGASTNGAVQPGTGLSVSGGVLNHTNSATAGTYTKVTIDAQGHVSTGTTLSAADIPVLDTSKITTGTFAANLIGTNTITGEKLANSSTIKFGGSGSTSGVVEFPTADFQGQLFWDELNGDMYIWNGSAWLSVTVTSGELVFAGIYNASTNLITSVSAAGAGLGLAAGAALPAASATNLQYYFVIGTTGTGTAPAPAVALQPPDFLISTGTTWTLVDVSTTVAAANNATGIVFTPAGDIVATNVQTAIQELDTEKLSKTGGTMTGNLEIGTAGSLVFKGASYDTTLTRAAPNAARTITLPNATGTVITTGDTGTVTSTMISNDTILNADINSSAAIDYSKLAALTSANILVGSSANVATSRAVTGDVTINNTGVTAIASDVIINADIKSDAASDYSKLAALTSANILVGSSANVATARAVTGDVLINNTGVTSINTGVIVNDDIAGGTITDAKLAQITTAGKVSGSAITTGNISTSGNITTTGTLTVQSITVGKGAGAISTNTAVGNNALNINTTGNKNAAFGYGALSGNITGVANTAIGIDAIVSVVGGGGNIGIGGYNNTGNYAPVFEFGTGDENNRIVMGSTAVTNAYVQVAWTVVSDERDKMNFNPILHGLNFVKELKPTAFQFKISRDNDTPNGPVRYGFKAQDILKLEGKTPVIIDNDNPEKLRYNGESLVPILVKAIQELTAKVEALEARC